MCKKTVFSHLEISKFEIVRSYCDLLNIINPNRAKFICMLLFIYMIHELKDGFAVLASTLMAFTRHFESVLNSSVADVRIVVTNFTNAVLRWFQPFVSKLLLGESLKVIL